MTAGEQAVTDALALDDLARVARHLRAIDAAARPARRRARRPAPAPTPAGVPGHGGRVWWAAGPDVDAVALALEARAARQAEAGPSSAVTVSGLTPPAAGLTPPAGGVDLRPLPAPADLGPVRLVVVDPDERKLRLARLVVATGEPWRGGDDVWFVPAGAALAGVPPAAVTPSAEPPAGTTPDRGAAGTTPGGEAAGTTPDRGAAGTTPGGGAAGTTPGGAAAGAVTDRAAAGVGRRAVGGGGRVAFLLPADGPVLAGPAAYEVLALARWVGLEAPAPLLVDAALRRLGAVPDAVATAPRRGWGGGTDGRGPNAPGGVGAVALALHDAGVRVFVDLGHAPAHGELPRILARALDGRDHVTVTALAPGARPLARLDRALAALWVEGVAVLPDALHRPLPPEPEPGPGRDSIPSSTTPPTHEGET